MKLSDIDPKLQPCVTGVSADTTRAAVSVYAQEEIFTELHDFCFKCRYICVAFAQCMSYLSKEHVLFRFVDFKAA